MQNLTVKIPSWINKNAAKKEFLSGLRAKAQLKMEFDRSMEQPFEKKYNCTLEDFKKQIDSGTEENIEQWDDLIEWEAANTAFWEWKSKLQELS